jgi:hypothetical protein
MSSQSEKLSAVTLATKMQEEEYKPFVFSNPASLINFLELMTTSLDIDFNIKSHIIRDLGNSDLTCMLHFVFTYLKIDKEAASTLKTDTFAVIDMDPMYAIYCYIVHVLSRLRTNVDKVNTTQSPGALIEQQGEYILRLKRLVVLLKQSVDNNPELMYTVATQSPMVFRSKTVQKVEASAKKSGMVDKWQSFLTFTTPVMFSKFSNQVRVNEEIFDFHDTNRTIGKLDVLEEYVGLKKSFAGTFFGLHVNDPANTDPVLSQLERNLHCVVSPLEEKQTLRIPCRKVIRLQQFENIHFFVLTSASNDKELYISFRVKGYPHRKWVYFSATSNKVKPIDCPDEFAIGKLDGKNMKPKEYSKWVALCFVSDFFEFGLDRV